MRYFAIVLASYLIGSIPWGLLISRRFYRVDLREHGSGNIGFTNAFRILGPTGGLIVLLGDVSKGLLSIELARWLGAPELALVLAGLAAIFGHNWSLFLGFSGGRGVATAAGVILALMPVTLLILLTIWLVVLTLFRYVSVASLSVAFAFPLVTVYLYRDNPWYIFFSLLASLVVTFKHIPNIKRLLAQKEPQVNLRSRRGGDLDS